MALNDAVLSDIGFIDPVTAGLIATTVARILPTGPTSEFLERQAYREAKDVIVAKYKAIMPSLPEWQRKIVERDLDQFVYKMTRGNMKVGDYRAAMAWWDGRVAAWGKTTAEAAPAEAGFNWPVILVAGGVLVWLLLGKK